jgi:metal-responsive CopG/Arc/MetJ family transcriptional regulator
MMQRTQILLPAEMLYTLRKKAEEEKTSVSDIVRTMIDRDLEQSNEKKKSGKDFLKFLMDHPIKKKGIPKDLSSNDDYLYGDV